MSPIWPPVWYPPQTPTLSNLLAPQPVIVQYHIGCICPPGANKDCERPDCPRKNPAQAQVK